MKLTNNIHFENFKSKKNNKKIQKLFNNLINTESHILNSLRKSYKDSWNKKIKLVLKKYKNVILIGMGGSIMGSRAIYSFFNKKIKKNFYFVDSFEHGNLKNIKKKNCLNLIISKSGNTLETITNVNYLKINRKKSILITENRKSYVGKLAKKLKSELILHNNFIGGRYSVLSEVGMLPAELMGLKPSKFRQLNNLIKNKTFINALISNVSNLLDLANRKMTNSIILNYDEKSFDLFNWYQQLVAESLGKKGKGFHPIISTMPKDNHSLMQLYLSGPRNNFFTFFFCKRKLFSKNKK